jgi:iron complex transport system substrate-binding protein
MSLPLLPKAILGRQATPAADLAIVFPEGTLPTIFGDLAIMDSVERVVTITDGALDAAITLGVQPVGATRSSNGERAAEYLMDQVSPDIQYIGDWAELDLGLIVSLTLDVILGDRYMPEDQYALLSGIAPTFATGEVEVAIPDAAGVQQWEYELLAWAHVPGKGAEAETAIAGARAAGIAATCSTSVD